MKLELKMKTFVALAVAVLAIAVLASTAHGVGLITPTVTDFSTQLTDLGWGYNRDAVNCVNGSGLTGPGNAGDGHVNYEDPSVVWTTVGSYEVTDYDPYITFDLGDVYDVTGIREWGYNSNFQVGTPPVNIAIIGPDEVDVYTSTDGVNFTLATTVNFALAPGVDGYGGNDIAVNLPGVRYIKLDIITNHDGAVFDGTGSNGGLIDGRSLTGLSEIRFEKAGPAAANPDPYDGQENLCSNVVLSWTPGKDADKHDVYFGTDEAKVTDANRANPLGVLVSEDQALNYYPASGTLSLDFGKTYYWRIDEVADLTVYEGEVWSFTLEPYSYSLPGEIDATASSVAEPDDQLQPVNTVNGSGLDVTGLLHGDSAFGSMWLSSVGGPQPTRIEYKFDRLYKLHEMWVWNFNGYLATSALLTPTVADVSSQNPVGFDRAAVYSVDGSGLTGDGSAGSTHAQGEGGVAWTTSGPYDATDYDPYITYDLGDIHDVTLIREWGYNSAFQDATLAAAGVNISIVGPNQVDVYTSVDNVTYTLAGTVNFALAPGTDGYAGNEIAVNYIGVRYIKLDIMTNHDGAVFDGTGAQGGLIDGRGLTGLSEIRFEKAVPPTTTHYGFKNVTIEYSADDITYTPLGTTHEFSEATGAVDYPHNTTIDFEGVEAQYVRLTANSNHGLSNQYGLSEVRFFSLPTRAREPGPENNATGVALDVVLTWTPGREAATHDVYLGADWQAVADSTVDPCSIPAGGTCRASYGPLSLELGKIYYWKVNEVNLAEEPNTWEGDVWSFSTPEYVVVEDFEDYNDTAGFEVFSTWSDGWQVDANGSQIGYLDAPYLEQTIVHGGSWSAPLHYDNTDTVVNVVNSEVTRTFDSPQNWSTDDIRALTLFFYGQAGNTTPSAGEQMYVKLNDVKVAYDGDMADITQEQWHQWDIDLALFGVNLANVTTISIGFDRGASPASGVVYFDDIRLYPSRCVPSKMQAAADFDNDCKVGYSDLDIMVNNWLISNYEVTPAAPEDVNLVAYWKLDENTGTLVGDETGNHDGFITDPFSVTWGTGKFGAGLEFDGVQGEVDCGDINLPGSVTISAWLKPDATGSNTYRRAVSKGNYANGWHLGLAEYKDGYYVIDGAEFSLTEDLGTLRTIGGTTSLEAHTWHHIVGVYDIDTDTMSLYVNGNLENSTAISPTSAGIMLNDNMFMIGRAEPEGGYGRWPGSVDEIRYYNRALSDGEAAWLAGKTTPFTLPLHLLLTPADPAINMYDDGTIDIINFKDFAKLMNEWLEEPLLWPAP